MNPSDEKSPIDFRTENDIVIIEFSGDLDIDTHLSLKKQLRDSIEDGCRKFILNVNGIKNMDSTGIGVLVTMLNSIRLQGGDMWLAGTFNSDAEKSFALCGLQRVFTQYADVQTAIKHFAS